MHNPLTGTGEVTGGATANGTGGFAGFTAGSAPDRRQQRTRTIAGVLAGVAVLGAVGIVAATTGSKTKAAPASISGPPVGKAHPGPVPPRMVFVDAKLGYALYANCTTQPDGDGCAARLRKTVDGGQHWTELTLPAGAPVDSSSWADFVAHGTDVMITWNGGIGVSADSGATWHRAVLEGATSAVRPTDFLINSEVVVDPVKATAATFRPPASIELAGESGGQLSDGTLWLEDSASYGISDDGGNDWAVATAPDPNVPIGPRIGPDKRLVRISGPATGLTIGRSGDGGELTATTASFSSNRGATWTAQALTGPADNAFCTVFLPDGSLLGVAVDGSGLLSLPKGGSTFVPVTNGPATTPFCLVNNGSMIWGLTFTNQLVTSQDGKHWTTVPLDPKLSGVASPSPTPSIAH